jgi:Type IX secretion system protein PorV
MKKITWLGVIASLFFQTIASAQCYKKGNQNVTQYLTPCPNTVVSAVPFLRITPDARGGAMGDVGIAVSADANSMHLNTSKLVFSEEDAGVSATYTPWLRALGLTDIYLAYLAGYKKLNDRQAIGVSARYFSLGEITYTNENGGVTGTGSPNEFEVNIGFAQKLSKNFSAAVNGKFINSNLASGQVVGAETVSAAKAGAADISFTYQKPIKTSNGTNMFRAGIALTNVGSKITYTKSQNRDYLPANLGIGASYEMHLNEYNTLTFAVDLNKLAVPTPVPAKILDPIDENAPPKDNPDYDKDPKDGVPDWKQKGPITSVISSFGDASLSEELKEWTYGLGVEYWYDKQFSVRAGYFNENKLKGGRKYLTLGLGLKYNVFGLNFSYLVPTTSQRNPLDNTLRFSLLFDFAAMRAESSN